MKAEGAAVPGGVLLHLSHDEAQALMDLCQVVGGPPEKTRRRHIESIERALSHTGLWSSHPLKDVTGIVYFYSDTWIPPTHR